MWSITSWDSGLMLRRKLMVMLISLSALFLGLAIVALVSLQGLFTDVDHINNEAARIIEPSAELSQLVPTIGFQVHRLQAGTSGDLEPLSTALRQLREHVEPLGEHYVLGEDEIEPIYMRLLEQIDLIEASVAQYAGSDDVTLRRQIMGRALVAAARIRDDIEHITHYARLHLNMEQVALTSRFRWLVIGLAVGFLLVLNVSVLLLMRTARMILQPVEQLVLASRELARENFEYRVNLGHKDEFGELAEAYNHLAEQLQEREQRKLEMIGHVALTLNHELNNAITIIDLQLSLLKKRSAGGEAFEKSLHEIHQSLERMAKVVESLKHIRRVVLTDYVAGLKMLDLDRSVQAEPPSVSEVGSAQEAPVA